MTICQGCVEKEARAQSTENVLREAVSDHRMELLALQDRYASLAAEYANAKARWESEVAALRSEATGYAEQAAQTRLDADREIDSLATSLAKALDGKAAAEAALATERARALEEAALRAEAEEELDGPMPETVRYAVERDPGGALRGAVRATKKGIATGIRSLSASPPPAPAPSPDPANCSRPHHLLLVGEVCPTCKAPAPQGEERKPCRKCHGTGQCTDHDRCKCGCNACQGKGRAPRAEKGERR